MGREDVTAGKIKQVKGKANDIAAPYREHRPPGEGESPEGGRKDSGEPREGYKQACRAALSHTKLSSPEHLPAVREVAMSAGSFFARCRRLIAVPEMPSSRDCALSRPSGSPKATDRGRPSWCDLYH